MEGIRRGVAGGERWSTGNEQRPQSCPQVCALPSQISDFPIGHRFGMTLRPISFDFAGFGILCHNLKELDRAGLA